MNKFLKIITSLYRSLIKSIIDFRFTNIYLFNILDQMRIVGPDSLGIVMITAFFTGIVFTIQFVKEFLYINAVSLIGAVLTLAFIRELSPVLTSIIIVGRVGSYFTAELATMSITQQLDALYLLEIDPLSYLALPRIMALVVMLPLLNCFSIMTSLFASSFICFTLYNIYPDVFFASSFSSLLLVDLFKSSLKAFVFGFFISLISCICGLTTRGGSKAVGQSTTFSVIISLLAIFIFDFLLSYIMFSRVDSSIKTL
uniref:ABC transporter permease n=1 Tax=Melanthalia intermedia TaxID=172989 RepID=A0A345UAI8_9FLOR|nr:hypothetical protein [Melanthalia intermedia]AXI97474.1 hypothetical protein [Melanthalia intermedia]